MDVRTLLEVMVKQEASDLYLTVDAPPIYRIHGSTHRTDAPPFTDEHQEQYVPDHAPVQDLQHHAVPVAGDFRNRDRQRAHKKAASFPRRL